jgi:murein DD-endopeptidase MepM/ murein hydrolase activator NlpD
MARMVWCAAIVAMAAACDGAIGEGNGGGGASSAAGGAGTGATGGTTTTTADAGSGGAGTGGENIGGAAGCASCGFGYPVGDLASSPAGGWVVTQVLGHYLNFGNFVGGHLAHDIASPNGEAATANSPVHSVADGVVLYAGANTSSYVNVVLIEHDLGDGNSICSFYGHLGSVAVSEGQNVARGDHIANVLDWNAQFGSANSHLHYVLLSPTLCAASAAASGALICGYDSTSGPNGITDLSNEPATYTSVGDVCGDHNYPDAFYSPTKFIDAHHF